MKKKTWVKVAAFALALTLLWMNMADVRNILDANAEAEENREVNGEELKIGNISIDEKGVTDQGTVTILVPIASGQAKDVTLMLMAEGSEEQHSVPAAFDEETNTWKAVLSVSENEWMKDGKVFVASVTATDAVSEEAVSAIVAGDNSTSARPGDATALYYFTVKRQSTEGEGSGNDPSKNPEDNDPDQNGENIDAALAVGEISIRIGGEKETASEGDTVTVLVKVNGGDGNETVTVAFGMEGSEDTHTEPLIYDPDANAYKAELNVTEEGWMKPGKVYISSVTATDESGKEVKGKVTEDGADSADVDTALYFFTVVETEQPPVEDKPKYDNTAPVIDDISMDKQGETLKDGDTVTISVAAYDPESEVKSVSVEIRVVYDSGYFSWEDELEYNETNKRWEETLEYGRYYLGDPNYIGKWYIGNVTAVNENNLYTDRGKDSDIASKLYAPDNTPLHWFMVTGEKPPEAEVKDATIDSVMLKEDGEILKPGDMLNIEVQVSKGDKELRKENGCEIQISTDAASMNGWRNDYENIRFSLDWSEEKRCYCGSSEITDKMYPGIWKIYCIRLYYGSGVRSYYSWDNEASIWKDYKFTLKNDDYDVEPPQVREIAIDRRGEEISPGENVKLSVKATDNEGIANIRARFVATTGNLIGSASEKDISLERVGETDEYVGTFTVGERTYPCEWYLDYIYIKDISTNHQYISTCKAGEYNSGDIYAYDADNYSLREKFYFNVVQTGDVVDQDTVTVPVYGYRNSGDSWEYGYLGSTEILRRGTGNEILDAIKAQYGTNLPEGVSITGCASKRGSSDTGEDPVVLWEGNSVNIQYDKNLIMLTLHDSYDSMNFMDYPVLYQGMIAGKEGETLELPKELPGLRNIEWKTFDGLKYSTIDNIIVGSDPVQYVYGCAEADADAPDTPVVPDTPVTPDIPVNPSPTGPVALPYLKIAEVSAEITAAGNGAVVTVDMGAATVVPKDILEAAKGKDVKVVLEMDGYTWSINGRDILSSHLKDVNLKVIRNTDYIPSGLISRLAGDNPVEQITLEYNGDFGFTADLTMNIGSQYAGKTGSLYWHDSDGRMIFMNAGAVDTAGNVTLGFSHASDYAVVITGPAATVAPNAAAVSVTKPTAVAVKTGDTSPIAFYAILLIAALAAGGLSVGTAVCRKKRSGRKSK